MSDGIRRAAEYALLSCVSRTSGCDADLEPQRGGAWNYGRARTRVRDLLLLPYRSQAIFLSRSSQRISDFAGRLSALRKRRYLDVISLHQAGFTNAIASLGTAITPEQAKLISRYTKKVNVCYDSDEAGQKATQRAMKILSDAGLEVVVIQIPGEKDPDDYIKTYGKEKFADILNGAKSKFEYNMSSIISKYDVNIPQDRINALKELEQLISKFYSKAERDIYIQSVSEKLKVDQKSVKDDVERLVKRNSYNQKKSESEKLIQSAYGYSDRVNPDFARAPEVASNEENVLGLMLVYPEFRSAVVGKKMLSAEHFLTDLNRRIFEYLCELEENPELDDVNSRFGVEEVGRITKIKVNRMKFPLNGDETLDEAVTMLKRSVEKKTSENIQTFDELDKLLNSKRIN